MEVSQDELTEFLRLREAVEGKSRAYQHFSHGDLSRSFEFDFTNVFSVIRAFYLAHFQLNELQQLLDEIKDKLNSK